MDYAVLVDSFSEPTDSQQLRVRFARYEAEAEVQAEAVGQPQGDLSALDCASYLESLGECGHDSAAAAPGGRDRAVT